MAKTVKKKKVKPSHSAPDKKTKKVRRHRIKEILLGFAILVVLIMITPAVLSLFFKDIPPVSAPDLALSKVTVPVADNAYYDLIKLEQAAVDVPELIGQPGFSNEVLTGVRWEQKAVDDALARNTEALGYFEDAAKKSSYQYPAYADPANLDLMSFESLHGSLVTSRIAALSAMNLQKQGKEKEAFQQAFDIIHVGKSIQQSQSLLVGFLVAGNMKSTGLQAIQQLLANTTLSKVDLSPIIAQVQSIGTDTESLVNAFKMDHAIRMEYFNEDTLLNNPIVRDTYSFMRQGVIWRYWVPRSYYYQPNKIISDWVATDRAVIAANTTPCDQTAQPVIAHSYQSINRFTFWLRLYFFPNAIGKIYNELGFWDSSSIRQYKCNEDALNSATQTLIALKEFSQDNGTLPIALEQLVPTYLSAIPIDPYDGKAIKYSAEKKIIYSVGSDHVDNGGSTGDDWQKMDDPTFMIK